MADYALARRVMVDRQVRTADVTDLRIISALLEVPREMFVPAARRAIAYLDLDVPVNEHGRVLLKPMVFAKLLQAAGIGETDRVLDVGCATGYSAGGLAKLAGDGWAQRAPYDVIVLEGAADVVPDSLLSQLKDGGRLVAVVGIGPMGKATLYRRAGGHATAQPVFDAAAPPLPGFIKPAAFVF